MKKLFRKLSVLSIFALSLSALFFALPMESIKSPFVFTQKVKAYDTDCPSGLTDSECLNWLKDKSKEVNNEISNLQNQLEKEKFDQLSLYEQISYMKSTIAQKEAEIGDLEIQIEQNNIEIRILLREIDILQDKIDTASQEIKTLQNELKKRIGITYKYSRISPLQVILKTNDLDDMSRKIQYLQKTKEKDVKLLDSMSNEIAELNDQQQNLAQKKYEVQTKRNTIEEHKTQVFEEKSSLEAQRSTLNNLVAQSEIREQKFLENIQANQTAENALEAAIIEQINKNVTEDDFKNGDYIPAGGLVGYMGNTGHSGGTHLHFSYGGQPGYYCNGTINPFASGYLILGTDYLWENKATGYKYYYVRSGTLLSPVEPTAALSQTFHQGYAIDLVHAKASDPNYNVKIYASHSGKILRFVDRNGGKYAIIRNSTTGLTSCYLHLK